MKTSLRRLLFILLLSLCFHLALLLVPAGNAIDITDNNNMPMQAQLSVRLVPAEKQFPDTTDSLLQPYSGNSIKTESLTEQKSGNAALNQSTAALPILNPDTPTYYPSQLLSEKPRILEDPLYEMAHKLPTEANGKLVLRLRINKTGVIDDAVIEKSDIKADYLPQLQRAAMGMRFTPGRMEDKAVNTEMRIEVEIDTLRPWP